MKPCFVGMMHVQGYINKHTDEWMKEYFFTTFLPGRVERNSFISPRWRQRPFPFDNRDVRPDYSFRWPQNVTLFQPATSDFMTASLPSKISHNIQKYSFFTSSTKKEVFVAFYRSQLTPLTLKRKVIGFGLTISTLSFIVTISGKLTWKTKEINFPSMVFSRYDFFIFLDLFLHSLQNTLIVTANLVICH